MHPKGHGRLAPTGRRLTPACFLPASVFIRSKGGLHTINILSGQLGRGDTIIDEP